jgi:hypothetical protein
MSTPAIQVYLLKDCREQFIALLREGGVEFSVQTPPVGAVMNSGFAITVSVPSSVFFGALASVICAFLKNRRSRKVIITTDNAVIQAEGLSQSDLERLLPVTRSMIAIETARDTTVSISGEPVI